MFQKVDQHFASRQFTRPARRSDFLEGACRKELGGLPIDVPVHVASGAEPLRCFWNVADKVRDDGGEIVFGWGIFEWPYLFWEAQHHAVWRNPDGSLVDVTPPPVRPCPSMMFVADAATRFDLESSAPPEETRRFPLVDWIELSNYSGIGFEVRARCLTLEPAQQETDPILQDLRKTERGHKKAMLVRLANHLRESDPCFCGTRAPFGACCIAKFAI